MAKQGQDKQAFLTRKAVVKLYDQYPGEWFLLKVLERDKKSRKGLYFELIAHSPDKQKLYDLLDREDWDWEGDYIFVFSDPDKVCEI